jgi:hypothetical protein
MSLIRMISTLSLPGTGNCRVVLDKVDNIRIYFVNVCDSISWKITSNYRTNCSWIREAVGENCTPLPERFFFVEFLTGNHSPHVVSVVCDMNFILSVKRRKSLKDLGS